MRYLEPSIGVDRRLRLKRTTSRSAPVRLTRGLVTVVACVAQAVLGVTVLVSGLIMPNSVVVVLGLIWTAGVAVMIRGRRRRALMLAVPIASWIVWLGVAWIGETALGWTA